MTATPPPLPTLRALTAELRSLHASWGSHPDVGEYVSLCPGDQEDPGWHVMVGAEEGCRPHGREFIPGSVERECSACEGRAGGPVDAPLCSTCNGSGRVRVPSPFDAVAAARRLLAAARDGLQ